MYTLTKYVLGAFFYLRPFTQVEGKKVIVKPDLSKMITDFFSIFKAPDYCFIYVHNRREKMQYLPNDPIIILLFNENLLVCITGDTLECQDRL